LSNPAHDQELKYQQVGLGIVEDVFQVVADTDGITVDGACPRCHGKTSTTFPMGVAGSKGLFSRSGAKPPSAAEQAALKATETFLCECGFAHTGQPENTPFEGCGAQWKVGPGSPSGSGNGGTP
jgi:hypothetical protein